MYSKALTQKPLLPGLEYKHKKAFTTFSFKQCPILTLVGSDLHTKRKKAYILAALTNYRQHIEIGDGN
jgi:hypothetical protein